MEKGEKKARVCLLLLTGDKTASSHFSCCSSAINNQWVSSAFNANDNRLAGRVSRKKDVRGEDPDTGQRRRCYATGRLRPFSLSHVRLKFLEVQRKNTLTALAMLPALQPGPLWLLNKKKRSVRDSLGEWSVSGGETGFESAVIEWTRGLSFERKQQRLLPFINPTRFFQQAARPWQSPDQNQSNP